MEEKVFELATGNKWIGVELDHYHPLVQEEWGLGLLSGIIPKDAVFIQRKKGIYFVLPSEILAVKSVMSWDVEVEFSHR